jgi:hypothetical protein
VAGEPHGSPALRVTAGLLIPPPCPLTLLNVVTERACNSGGRIMTKQTTLTSPDSPTREQLVRRVAFLERVTLTASMNADRFSKHAERIAALARAIKSAELSLVDRITLVEAVEFLAATAETDAALDAGDSARSYVRTEHRRAGLQFSGSAKGWAYAGN